MPSQWIDHAVGRLFSIEVQVSADLQRPQFTVDYAVLWFTGSGDTWLVVLIGQRVLVVRPVSIAAHHTPTVLLEDAPEVVHLAQLTDYWIQRFAEGQVTAR